MKKIGIICAVALAIISATSGVQYDICNDQPTGHFFKDYSDCKGYIACVNSHSVFGSCPDKLLFNSTTRACDYSDLVECQSCPRDGVTTFPMSGSCRKYVRCVQGRAEYLECPSNLFYDQSRDSCNVQANVDCVEEICDAYGTYLTASREDCTAYYSCVRGEATRMECRNGLYYNPVTRTCDFAANVQCDIAPPKLPEIDDVTVACPPSGQHFYPHPTDCSHYFICYNGVGAKLSCGPVLQYDIATQNCQMPDRTTCITKFI